MDKEKIAIERLQIAAQMSEQLYQKPLLITYSGGKDSDVMLRLAIKAKIPMEVVNSHTSVDMPETVYHIRDVFRRLENDGYTCKVVYPTYKGKPVTMWMLIPQKGMPPTRKMRYCCSVLKETTGKGRFVATGVRKAESRQRAGRESFEVFGKTKKQAIRMPDAVFMDDNSEKRRLFETCNLKARRAVNPIIDWTDGDVWDYITAEKIGINPKYCEGYRRIGCVGCPMAGRAGREREFAEYPTYQNAYIHAFDRMLQVRRAEGKNGTWQTGADVYHWWMEDGVMIGQTEIEGML